MADQTISAAQRDLNSLELNPIFGPKQTSSQQYEEVRRWRATLKRRLVIGFGGRCGICRVTDHDIIYDFHHLDPAKKDFQPTSKIRAWEKVIAEVKKCIMVCTPCHRKIHAGLVTVPADISRFDDRLVQSSEFAIKVGPSFDECPVCGKLKSPLRKACSRSCSTKRVAMLRKPTDLSVVANNVRRDGYAAVAAECRVGVKTVKRWFREAGLDQPKYQPPKKPSLAQQQSAVLIRLRRQGQHLEEGPGGDAGARFDRIGRRYKRPKPEDSPIKNEVLLEGYAAGVSCKKLAKLFGVTPSAVKKRLVKLGAFDAERGKVVPKPQQFCPQCGSAFKSSRWAKTFCSRSCAAHFNNSAGIIGRKARRPAIQQMEIT